MAFLDTQKGQNVARESKTTKLLMSNIIPLKTLNSSVRMTKFNMKYVLSHFEVFKERGTDSTSQARVFKPLGLINLSVRLYFIFLGEPVKREIRLPFARDQA